MSGKVIGSFNLPTPKPHTTNVISKVRGEGQTDAAIIAEVIADGSYVLAAGDMLTILDMKDESIVGEVAYAYDGTEFKPLNYALDASKVYFTSDITCAGQYTAVGNVTKSTTGTTTIASSGKTVMDVFQTIFTKKLQPTITKQPSVTGFALTGAGKVEAGTKVASAVFGTAKLDPGAYTYGPATGIEAAAFSVDRVALPADSSATGVVAAASGTDDNGGVGFIIGDQGGDGVVSSLAYKCTVTYPEGAVANDNLGGASDPVVKIAAGSKTLTTTAYTPFRKYFYGCKTSQADEVNSAFVRGLTNSTGAAAKGTKITISVPGGATRVVIAYPATLGDLTAVEDKNAFGTDIKGSFVKSVVAVEGANGYTAIDYKVYVMDSGIALAANTLTATIG